MPVGDYLLCFMDPHREGRVRLLGRFPVVVVAVPGKTIAAVYDFCRRLGYTQLALCVCVCVWGKQRRKPKIIAAHAADNARPRPPAAV